MLVNIDIGAVYNRLDKYISSELNQVDFGSKHVIVIFYNESAAKLYANNISKMCKDYSIPVVLCSCNTREQFVDNYYDSIDNNDVIGMIVLKPIPANWNINVDYFTHSIPINKDIEAMGHDAIYRNYCIGDFYYTTCTCNACMDILDSCIGDYNGMNVTIIGRSNTVGKPISMAMLARNCNVTVLHSHTSAEDIENYITNSDILITATSVPQHITITDKNAVRLKYVIDVGTCYNSKGKLVGNVAYDSSIIGSDKKLYISPVPGGVGKITRLESIKHIIECWRKSN